MRSEPDFNVWAAFRYVKKICSAPAAMSQGTAGDPISSPTTLNDVPQGSARSSHPATWNGARPAFTTLTPTISGPGDSCFATLTNDARTSRVASLVCSEAMAPQELVSEIPAPLVTDMLGYSGQVTQKHAAEAGNSWAKYVRPNPQGPDANGQPGLW